MNKKLFFGVSVVFNVVTFSALAYVASLDVPEASNAPVIHYVTNSPTASLSAALPAESSAKP